MSTHAVEDMGISEVEAPPESQVKRGLQAPPIDRGRGPKEVCWAYVIANPDHLSAEELEASATRGLPISILLWGEDLDKFFRLIRQSAIDSQIQATLERQVTAVTEKLEAAAEKVSTAAESMGSPSPLGEALAREMVVGLVAQPDLVKQVNGIVQAPAELGNGDPLLMKKADYAERISVSVRKLADLIKQGLPARGKGRMVRVNVAAADRWVEEHLDDEVVPERDDQGGSDDEIERLARERVRDEEGEG